MADQETTTVVEVARTADRCTTAVRAEDFTALDSLLKDSPHREQLVAMWARLLITVVPEDMAADMVDQLWRRDRSEWLIAVEYFLDYAHRRDPASLDRFVAEVTSWPWTQQSAFAQVVLTTVATALPEGILPSHYLVARGLIIEAAEEIGCTWLTNPVAGLVALGWRDSRFPPLQLAFDLARHVDRELSDDQSRRQAITLLALVLGADRDAGEPVIVTLRNGARMISDSDDPEREARDTERATVVAARVVRHAGNGDLRRIDAELAQHAPGEHELVSVLLALALAAASHVRDNA
jgi:hypothetical protein